MKDRIKELCKKAELPKPEMYMSFVSMRSLGDALENATPRNMNRFEKLQFIHESLKELMELFDEENLFYETKTGRTSV